MACSCYCFSYSVASAMASDFSASTSFSRFGSTIYNASKVSTQALIQHDRFPAGSDTLNTFSFVKSGLFYLIFVTLIFLMRSICFSLMLLIFSSL